MNFYVWWEIPVFTDDPCFDFEEMCRSLAKEDPLVALVLARSDSPEPKVQFPSQTEPILQLRNETGAITIVRCALVVASDADSAYRLLAAHVRRNRQFEIDISSLAALDPRCALKVDDTESPRVVHCESLRSRAIKQHLSQ